MKNIKSKGIFIVLFILLYCTSASSQVVTVCGWKFDHLFLFTNDGKKLLEHDYNYNRNLRLWAIPEITRSKTVHTNNTSYYNFVQKGDDIYAFESGSKTTKLVFNNGEFSPEVITDKGGILGFDKSGQNMYLYTYVSENRAEILYYNILNDEVLWRGKIKISRYGHVESLAIGPENTIIVKLYKNKEYIFNSYRVFEKKYKEITRCREYEDYNMLINKDDKTLLIHDTLYEYNASENVWLAKSGSPKYPYIKYLNGNIAVSVSKEDAYKDSTVFTVYNFPEMTVRKIRKIPYQNILSLDMCISDDLFFVGRVHKTDNEYDLFYYDLENNKHGYLEDFNAKVRDLQDIKDEVSRNMALAKLYADKDGYEPIYSDIIWDSDKIFPYEMKIEGQGYYKEVYLYIYCSNMENLRLRINDTKGDNHYIPIQSIIKDKEGKNSISFKIEKLKCGKYYYYFEFKDGKRPEKMGIMVFNKKIILDY